MTIQWQEYKNRDHISKISTAIVNDVIQIIVVVKHDQESETEIWALFIGIIQQSRDIERS